MCTCAEYLIYRLLLFLGSLVPGAGIPVKTGPAGSVVAVESLGSHGAHNARSRECAGEILIWVSWGMIPTFPLSFHSFRQKKVSRIRKKSPFMEMFLEIYHVIVSFVNYAWKIVFYTYVFSSSSEPLFAYICWQDGMQRHFARKH